MATQLKQAPASPVADTVMVNGVAVEKHRYGDRLGFLPKHFYVARSIDGNPSHDGHGRTPKAALDAMWAKQERLAA